MLRKLGLSLLAWMLLFATSACSPVKTAAPTPSPEAPIELNVSAALGLKDALLEIKAAYETRHPEVKINYNLAAAGVLQSQIEQGAPTDIFISAANKQMDALVKKNLIQAATRKNLVSNDLVLIVPKNSPLGLSDFSGLTNQGVIHFGLGDPATVPAGQYGQEVLQHLGIWDSVKAKAVLAKDVRTILYYVETGNAEAGIVFSAIAATSDKVKIAATAPNSSHESIVFPGAVLSNSKQPVAAQEFFAFLSGPTGMEIFQKHGFHPAR